MNPSQKTCLWLFVAIAGFVNVVRAAAPVTRTTRIHSVFELASGIRKAEAHWDDPTWSTAVAHARIRELITQYVTVELNRGSLSRNSLEKNLIEAISGNMPRSWAEEPARVLYCGPPASPAYIVAFVLDEAAGGSTSVIQAYLPLGGTWALAGEGGSEMNDVDMHVQLLLVSSNGISLFAYGNIFGGNQAPSRGIAYNIAGDRIRPIWKMKSTLGLSSKLQGGKLILQYRDTKRFYARQLPDAFQDVFAQTGGGMTLLSHTPLAAAYQ